MDKGIARVNIEHFQRLLQDETDEAKRVTLQRLLTEEKAKLQGFMRPPGEKQA